MTSSSRTEDRLLKGKTWLLVSSSLICLVGCLGTESGGKDAAANTDPDAPVVVPSGSGPCSLEQEEWQQHIDGRKMVTARIDFFYDAAARLTSVVDRHIIFEIEQAADRSRLLDVRIQEELLASELLVKEPQSEFDVASQQLAVTLEAEDPALTQLQLFDFESFGIATTHTIVRPNANGKWKSSTEFQRNVRYDKESGLPLELNGKRSDFDAPFSYNCWEQD